MKIARLNDAPEIFYSLQGEGASLGTPTLFLRLAQCNLHCPWCDTKHSWGQGMDLSVAEVAEALRACHATCRHIVITGGEPLLQAGELEELLGTHLPEYSVEVESNGTLAPTDALAARVQQWNFSPKLSHAGQQGSLNPTLLAQLAQLPQVWFKFVVRGEEDWAEIEALDLPKDNIILMPCAATRAELEERRLDIAELCLQHGVRLGERLHLVLWGEKKGV